MIVAQNECTSVTWWTRSRTVHPGQYSTPASRWPSASSASAALWAAMVAVHSSCVRGVNEGVVHGIGSP
jgi:hypothetical protein